MKNFFKKVLIVMIFTLCFATTTEAAPPAVVSLSPLDDATGVSLIANLVITFDQIVLKETGNITIKKTSDNSTVEIIDVTSGQVTGGGTDTITINPSVTLASLVEYYVLIDSTAFVNSLSDPYAGISSTTAWSFTTRDTAAPLVSTLSPTDDATEVSPTANLVITFNEIVDVETGNITIKKTSDDSMVETIDVTSGQVTGTGTTTITINPSVTLSDLTEYYILIDATAFDDVASNSYAGISLTTAWSFTTADSTSPTVSTLSPIDNATEVSPTVNLVITFDEAVNQETGNITIKTTVDDTIVETIDVAGAQVTGDGTTIITINPSVNLSDSTEYYVFIDATAFDDVASNSYAGISSTTAWSFTTVNTTPVVVSPPGGAVPLRFLINNNPPTPKLVINPTPVTFRYNLGTTNLRLWSRGDSVMEIQRLLNDKLKSNLVIDGILGPRTTDVIKLWQREHNLVVDGIVGPITRNSFIQ